MEVELVGTRRENRIHAFLIKEWPEIEVFRPCWDLNHSSNQLGTEFSAFLNWFTATDLYLHCVRSFDRHSNFDFSVLDIESEIGRICEVLLSEPSRDCLICLSTPHLVADLVRLAIYQFRNIPVFIVKRTSIAKVIYIVQPCPGEIDGPWLEGSVSNKKAVLDAFFNNKVSNWEKYSVEIVSRSRVRPPVNEVIKTLIRNRLFSFDGVRSLRCYLKMKSRLKHLLSWSEKSVRNVIERGEKIIFVALHYQPERTSSPEGGLIYSQANLIRILLSKFPDHYVIVKDHPRTTASFFPRSNSLKFYQGHTSFADFGDERVLWSDEASSFLIDRADVVASLNGTVLLEAYRRGKQLVCGEFWWARELLGVLRFDGDSIIGPNKAPLDPDIEITRWIQRKEKSLFIGDVSEVFGGDDCDFNGWANPIFEKLGVCS